VLRLEDGRTERGIVGEGLETGKLTEVGNPVITDSIGNGTSERLIAEAEPAPGSDAVGFVVEALREETGEIFNGGGAKKASVNGGDTVGAV